MQKRKHSAKHHKKCHDTHGDQDHQLFQTWQPSGQHQRNRKVTNTLDKFSCVMAHV